MTMIVSDVSSKGILMVGDSAITKGNGEVIDGAVKVQYSECANVGFAIWGSAQVDHRRMDYWIRDFINNHIKKDQSIDDIGNLLAEKMNAPLVETGIAWKNLVRGIHLAGYKDGVPVLYHVHCGHLNEPAHELRLYRDIPDDKNWSELYYRYLLNYDYLHLRNGYHPLFGPMFDRVMQYAGDLRARFNIQLPYPKLENRIEFYKSLVTLVAGTLRAADLSPGVNDMLSVIGFTKDGLTVDERIPFADQPEAQGFESFI